MLELIGEEGSVEWRAANALKHRIQKLWPDLTDHQDDEIRLHVAVKMFGRKAQDLDLVLLAHFSEPRAFEPRTEFRPRDAEPVRPRFATVSNLALVIEVKSHDARRVRFDGVNAQVRYRDGVWKDVSEQSHRQLHSLKDYIREQKVPHIHVANLVFFPNLSENQLPPRPHNNIGGDASFTKILNILGEIAYPSIQGTRATIRAGKPDTVARLLSSPLFKSTQPTPLDRKKMDRIIKMREAWRRDWFDDLGKYQIILRGRGGAGKTVILNQLAYRAYDEHGARSLILTYNLPLIADMRRTMGLLGIPSNNEHGGIVIRSIMSLIGLVLRHFDLIADDDRFFADYKSNCSSLAELLFNGDISNEDIVNLKRKRRRDLDFDHVFVDEGQDWHHAEIEILRALYPPENLVIADGVDQFVRGHQADWVGGVDHTKRRMRRLRRCLRMKSNLANFANSFAKEMNLETWSVEPNDDANGGRIIIVEGDYLGNLELHNELIAEAKATGNAPVDLLMCIPPNLAANPNLSKPAQALQRDGQQVWDGTVEEIRKNHPESTEQLRIVQYDSCRGLEGWIVFALGFDDFWDFKLNMGLRSATRSDDLYSTHETTAHAEAARWAMIPLTRAMDTLLLQISHRNTYAGAALRRVADRYPDFVEWYSR